MIRWPVRCIAAVALVLLPACNRVTERSLAVEPHVSEAVSVGFDLEPLPSNDGSRQWIGTYNSGGKIARFRIDFGIPESTPGKTAGDPVVKSGEGTLVPEAGSDSSVLLVDLQKALRAKTAAKAPGTRTSVPFTWVSIGENLSQAPAGGFQASPSGNWTALKLIFGDGDRESEILLQMKSVLMLPRVN